jgi:uncharacterized RDD family membrane protein YckC/cytoskeletal protein CcmA (bactofilin family)
MNPTIKLILGALLLGCAVGTTQAGDASVTVKAGNAAAVVDVAGASSAGGSADASPAGTEEPETGSHHALKLHYGVHGATDHTRVSIGHNQVVPAGEKADNVVSVMGSSDVAGEVSEDVVTVMGNARVTGPVEGDVVAVMGNTYVDSRVGGDVVAVLGKVELGPHANIGGEINAVGGSVERDPAAAMNGGVAVLSSGMEGWDFGWLQNWITHCVMKGRLLAFSPGLSWAWIVALVSLAFYVLTALLMPRSTERYVRVLEENPGESLFAAFLTLLGTPVLIILLAITVIGIAAIPFLAMALLIAGSFGRIVMLAWIGTLVVRRTGSAAWSHPAATVLIGGLIVTALYTVPVIGMLTFQLIGFVGMGVVAYGLLLAMRGKSQANLATAPAAAPAIAGAAAAAAGVSAGATTGATAGATAGATPGITVDPAAVAAVVGAPAITYPRAGFWIRMFALFIDLVIVSVIVDLVLDRNGVVLLLLAVYGAVMWKLKGSTLGGMICHLHVVRLDGRPIDWPTAIVRALACFLSLIVAGLGFIWIAIDAQRQGWHDKIAGTVVVRVPKGVSLV